MKTSCIDCGVPSGGTRCEDCLKVYIATKNHNAYQRRKQTGRPQYGGGYRKRATAVRQQAERCWLCGQGPRPDDPWQADHILPAAEGGGPGPLAPAHRSCNIARANRARANKVYDGPALQAAATSRNTGRPIPNATRRRPIPEGERREDRGGDPSAPPPSSP